LVHDVAVTVVVAMAWPSIDTVIVGAPQQFCPFARITTPMDAGNERFVEAVAFWYSSSACPPDAVESAISWSSLAGDTTMDSASRVVVAAAACGPPGNVIAAAVKRLTNIRRRYRAAMPHGIKLRNFA
jgi:hypothetical protein